MGQTKSDKITISGYLSFVNWANKAFKMKRDHIKRPIALSSYNIKLLWLDHYNFKVKTYHETSLTKVGESWIPALASKMDECGSPMKSEETTSSSV